MWLSLGGRLRPKMGMELNAGGEVSWVFNDLGGWEVVEACEARGIVVRI